MGELRVKKVRAEVCGVGFGLLLQGGRILMVSVDPGRIERLLPGPWEDDREAARLLARIFAGREDGGAIVEANPFIARGTPFQRLVWEEIGRIGRGETRTYGGIAARIGRPGAARAVGMACNANPLAIVIPCHRVVGKSGPGGYAGGVEAKLRLLAAEKAAV